MAKSKAMNSAFYFAQLKSYFNFWFEPFQAAALMTQENQPVHIKYQNLPDIGTLPGVAEVVSRYLQVGEGDVVLTNDPYSGGSTLTALNLLMGVNLECKTNAKSPAEFTFCVRVNMKPHLHMTDTIEDEGVRIPPTPIRQGGKFNTELLKIISEHPHCPKNFLTTVEAVVAAMDRKVEQIKRDTQAAHLDWSKPRLKELFAETCKHFTHQLEHLASGEVEKEMTLESGEKLKLLLTLEEGKAKFDFTGSGPSAHLHLTYGATLGACIGAMVSVINTNLPLNAGIFEVFEVRAPQGSLVNAKYPAPVYQGLTDGAGLLANFILQCLGEIDLQHRFAHAGPSLCSFDLEFSNNLHFFDTLEPGMAASSFGRGVDALNPWQRSHLEPSIEEIERRYPLTVMSCSIRQKSGGSGNFEGGNGVTKAITVKTNCTLRWMITQASQKPEGEQGGKAASCAELYIQKAGQKEREKMPARGEFNMKAGDTVIMHSSGGGGYGGAA